MDEKDLFTLGITLTLLSPVVGVIGLLITIFSKKIRNYGILSMIASLVLLIIGIGTSIQNINGCGGGGLGSMH